jgi:acetyl esterase
MTEPYVRPDVAAFLLYLNGQTGPKTHELGAVGARQAMAMLRDLADAPIGELAVIRDLVAPGPAGDIPLRLFDARTTREPGPALVYFHGGGFVFGDLDSHAPFCAEIARVLDLPVIAVDYRLAPENPWPAAPDDCEAAARWIAASPDALGHQVTGLVLAGDSAGGALTIITSIALRDAPAPVPLLVQWPIYPLVDKVDAFASYHAFNRNYVLTAEGIAWFDDCYRADLSHWRGSPLRATQEGLPPTLVLTASLDPLRDQGRAYAAATCLAGVPTVYREAAGIVHGFVCMRKILPSANDDIAGALETLKMMIAEAHA